MFRIKPVKNHTIAKYSYQNSTLHQPKENAQAKLTTPMKPVNQIVNHGKVNPPLKQLIRPQNNINKDSKPINPRLPKSHQKTILKRNSNNNQHKLKISIPNTYQLLLKQNKSQQNYIGDVLKKQEVLESENPQNDHVGKNQKESKNFDKQVQTSQKSQQFQVKFSEQKKQEHVTQIITQKKKEEQTPCRKQHKQESKQKNNPTQAPPISAKSQLNSNLKNEQSVVEPQKSNERQLQMQNLMIKIQKRRQARQQQKRRIREMEQKRKQNQERALEFMNQHNRNEQLNQGVNGIIRLNDQLMHFSLAQSVMDLQIKKLLKTNFNQFPNFSQIKYQLQELERISMSYEIVRMDENNPLRNGLRNYRVEIFNRIGEEIIKAQSQGYSNPNFHILEHDGRISQPEGGPIPQALRGLSKENQKDFIKFVENVDNQDCTICLGSLKSRQIVAKLQCGHVFHSNCIEEWIRSSANCPTCRFNIKFGPKKI